MAEPFVRTRKDGTKAWYARVKLATGEWDSPRLRAARDRTTARKLNHELQEAEDRKAKGLGQGGALFVGTFAELCDYSWKMHIKSVPGAEQEASRLHHHGGAHADRGKPGASPLGPLLASLITPERLEQYFAALEGRTEDSDDVEVEDGERKGLAPRTINRIRSTFSTVFGVAQTFGKWPKGDEHNPALGTVERELEKTEHITLTLEQILPTLEAAGHYWAGPFAVCLLAGLRRGEMLALKKRDVDLERGVINVRRSARKRRNSARGTTKGNRHDALPIHPELRPYLEQWMSSPSEWMFPDHDGNMRSKSQRFDLRLQAALVRAGIVDHYEHRCRRKTCSLRVEGARGGHLERHPDDGARRCPACDMKLTCTPKAPKINFHATRHTFATAMLESGATLQGVQKLMRHSTPTLTTETYGHLTTGFLEGELGALDVRGAAERAAARRRATRGEGDAELPPARALAAAAEPRRGGANGDEKRHWATPECTGDRATPDEFASPVRRGRGAGGATEIVVDETSMILAAKLVEPRGIEPLTYALRMHEPADAEPPHASQALATVTEISHGASVSASHRSAAKTSVNSGFASPVRRGRGAASQARELEIGMHEQALPAPAVAPNESATVLLPVREVARRLGVSEKWVRYRIDLGELEPVRIGGSRIRISEASLAAFVRRAQR